MATSEQVEQIIALLRKHSPQERYKDFNKTNMGIGAVLLFLSNATEPVSAGQIGKFLSVSSARVTALLKKMEGKGLICTRAGASDARVTEVAISETGRTAFLQVESELRNKINRVIDQVGMDRLMEYADIADEIQDALNAAESNSETGSDRT